MDNDMKRPITADEVRRFFELADKQFCEAGFYLIRVRFRRIQDPNTGEERTSVQLDYEVEEKDFETKPNT